MKPDSATQWNREDKPRVHGKQEQSTILHTAGPCSDPLKMCLGCACGTDFSPVQLILQASRWKLKEGDGH